MDKVSISERAVLIGALHDEHMELSKKSAELSMKMNILIAQIMDLSEAQKTILIKQALIEESIQKAMRK